MKKLNKILSVFIASLTLFSCISFGSVSAETSVITEETTNFEIIEMGTLYIRKGDYKVIFDSQDATNLVIEDEDVAVLEKYKYIGGITQVRAIECGTTRVTYKPFASNSIHAWNIVVDDYTKTFELSTSEKEICIQDDECQLNIVDPYDDSYFNTISGNSIYNDNAVWESDNEDIVRVELGKIYPQSVGSATVTAELDGITYECNITVTPYIYHTGDVDMNKDINLYDVILIAKYIIGIAEISEEQLSLADYTNDSKIDLYDVIEISKTLMK